MVPSRYQYASRTLQAHSKAARAQDDFARRCEALRARLGEDDFLHNRGLGNEIGFFTFCYDASLELRAREFFAQLEAESANGALPCNLIVRNLYDTFLGLLEKKRILAAVPKQEARRGSDHLLKRLRSIATPEALAAELAYEPHQPGDVLLLTGVGEIYPFLRVHTLLDNMHVAFGDIPVVVAYPGRFNGQSFSLFNMLDDGNYYRAFDIS
ncbi:DUF1788 domain-containing protein [Senegalimassilia faecalis]|uniref:DUF1788 domain-containing protein n=1 Tax=Senegalimassilia faecalis TaxID=2509433 RepID=A0A4Q2JZN9_9ACTN|nr:DUF1788 domain-containing protein [Senegalimassilia faecalis]RXZ53460.1 DUF1788 domain-containing protein [Senegalimassilia faecalis]